MRRRVFTPVLLAIVLGAGAARAAAIDPALQAMAERKPDEAIRALRAALGKSETRVRDHLHYLLARAELQAKRYADAIKTADSLRELFPRSPWAHKVNFLKADALIAQKELKRAD